MATPIILPRQGQSVESCIITKWHKQVGDAVAEGDLLFTYETDKATFDEESKVSGTFLGAFFEEGDDVSVLLNVCVVGNPGEDISAFAPAGTEAAAAPAEPMPSATESTVSPAPSAPAPSAPNNDAFASPRARMSADKLGVDLRFAAPTGPNGRVIERDVFALQSSGHYATSAALPGLRQGELGGTGSGIGGRITTYDATTGSPAPIIPSVSMDVDAYEDVKLTNIRKAIAKNMLSSLQNGAQLTHHITFDATEILALRKNLKQNRENMGLPNITLNDIVLFAVSRTLKSYPDLNAHYLEKEGVIRHFSSVNLGIAVDTERGLIVPTLRGADRLSLSEISTQGKELAKLAQSGSITPDLTGGATFTISNLGAFGVEMFTPVINPPQTGILGICGMTQRIREASGVITAYPAMGLSLTYDHRALDGAPASRFLKDLVTNLENFTLLLSK